MPVFRYIATGSAGSTSNGLVRGELAADSSYQVRLALRRKGLLPKRVTEVRAKRSERRALVPMSVAFTGVVDRASRSRRRARLIELYENLAALLVTGTQITDALTILSEGNSRRSDRAGDAVRTLCLSMAERIRQGAALADAMAEHGEWFGAIDSALVRASEQTGESHIALEALAQHHGRAEELRGKLGAALAYPTLLFVFGVGVVIFLSTNTLPQLTEVLIDAGTPVPGLTMAVLSVGSLLSAHPVLAALALLCVVVLVTWLLRSDRLALARLRTPLLGRVLVRSQLSGASTLLARLLDGGLTLGEALTLVAPTIPNARIRDTFVAMERDLREGRSAASSLGDAAFIEPTYRQVLAVGEETGELPATLRAIGERYRASSSRLIDRLASVLEPAVILLLAVMVGLVVFAAILPMLRLTETL